MTEETTIITEESSEPTTQKITAELEAELAKYKKNFDKVASELAATRKLYKDKLTEEEKKAEEQQELQQALMTELEGLRKEKKTALITAKVTDLGIEAGMAGKIAGFYADDDIDSFFSHLKAFVNELKEQIRQESMKGQPSPQGGSLPEGDEPDFASMTLSEINEFYKKQGVIS